MLINRRTFLAGSTAALAAPPAFAQNYPTRPIHLVVPYPPGGGTDFFARVVSNAMGQTLGQQIVIENRPGAGGIVGAIYASHAPADGYTLLLGDTSVYASNVSLYRHLAYDPKKDFAPVSLTGRFAIVLLVNTDKLKVSSVKELIEVAKKAPGTVDYGTAGVGSPFHLAGELFAQAAGIKIQHVPYKGAAPAVQGLVAGEVGMMPIDFATARGQLANKQIKAIAVTSGGEFPGLPGVPPVAKDLPGYEAWAWQGFAAPAGTPKEAIDKLNDAYLKAASDPAIKQKLVEAGIDPLQSTPLQMADYVAAETAKWEKVIRTANISLD